VVTYNIIDHYNYNPFTEQTVEIQDAPAFAPHVGRRALQQHGSKAFEK
jgi:hypothetical protein